MTASDAKPFGRVAKFFHWSFPVLFGFGIFKALDNVGQLADQALLHFEMGFAMFFLAFLVARFAFMRRTQSTSLPDGTPRHIKISANAVHLAMYTSLAAIAISGIAIGGLYEHGFASGAAMTAAIALHEFSIAASYILIGLHIAAALYHRIKRDGIWNAMVPVFQEKATSPTE
ncbi:cytochrome b [Roseibium sediminis]|uniref:cytochrome b n=1 Tax=Roseibium sediminis TaxID=1775174 RepID=UPI00123C81CC|nr:cytochrome b/b6 domain-containing protein [Roseibium sediminis]